MSKVWLTSDWHFNHDREFIYGPRGFSSIKEANEEIIRRHNEVVDPEDSVFVLGDLMLGNNDEGIKCIKRLNGHLNIILGNHDTDARIQKYKEELDIEFWQIEHATKLKYKKWTFYLSHCPMLVAHKEDDAKLWSLHGHTHSKEKFSQYDNCYNVNLDAHNCYPVDLDTIIEDIKNFLNKA